MIFWYYVFGGNVPINDPNSTAILNNTDKKIVRLLSERDTW